MGRSGWLSLLHDKGRGPLSVWPLVVRKGLTVYLTMPRSCFPSAHTIESLEQQMTQLSSPLSSQCKSLLLQASVFLFTKVPEIGGPLGLSTVLSRDPPLGD